LPSHRREQEDPAEAGRSEIEVRVQDHPALLLQRTPHGLFERFDAWCTNSGLEALPATPQTVAL